MAWARACLLLALVAPWGRDVLAIVVGNAGQNCRDEYVREMSLVNVTLGALAKKMFASMAPYTSRGVSQHPLIIGAGHGGTGTRSIFEAVAMQHYKSTHWAYSSDRSGTIVRDDRHIMSTVGKLLSIMTNSSLDDCASGIALNGFDWSFLDEWDTAFDTPVSQFWYDLYLTHPNSRVIYTQRPPREWARQRQTFCKEFPDTCALPLLRACGESVYSVNEDQLAAAYEANFAFMKCAIPPERLLIVDVFKANGNSTQLWEALCTPSWIDCLPGQSRGTVFPGVKLAPPMFPHLPDESRPTPFAPFDPAVRARKKHNSTPRERILRQQAMQEAKVDPGHVSFFGSRAVKIPQSWMDMIAAVTKNTTKHRKYVFIGSVFNHKAAGRRHWVVDFAKANFTPDDFLIVTDAPQDYKPLGSFDHSLEEHWRRPSLQASGNHSLVLDLEYVKLLASSEYTLCPGGNDPWSSRLYEAAAAGSIPLIRSRSQDFDPPADKAWLREIGYAYTMLEGLRGANTHADEDQVEANFRKFVRYQTFLEGDVTPPK